MCLQPQAPAPQPTPAPILHQPVQAVPQQHLQQGICHIGQFVHAVGKGWGKEGRRGYIYFSQMRASLR